MYSSSAAPTFGCSCGGAKLRCQKYSQRKPIAPINTNDHCQPKALANSTVSGAAITPTLVPELKIPVASARSFCGNHIATALIDAGKFTASATPRKNRTTTKPITDATRPCAAAATDQTTSASARLF